MSAPAIGFEALVTGSDHAAVLALNEPDGYPATPEQVANIGSLFDRTITRYGTSSFDQVFIYNELGPGSAGSEAFAFANLEYRQNNLRGQVSTVRTPE